MSKDWTGKPTDSRTTIGVSSKQDHQRQQHDYYATEPKAVRMLLELESFEGTIWECACGEGHLSKEMERLGYEVHSSDLVDRGYGEQFDFLSGFNNEKTTHNIITNPPYKYVAEWITKAMGIMQKGKKMALFLPIRYLEGKERGEIFKKCPPQTIYVSSSRIKCAMNGDFENMSGSMSGYAWFVWEIGYKGYTILKWFN